MVPAKLLVGGTVAVGSTATAAVVANKYGLFSTSTSLEGNQDAGAESGNTIVDTTNDAPAETPTPVTGPTDTQTKQKEIEELIKTKVGGDITVNISDGTTGTPLNKTSEDKLDKLKEYLTEDVVGKLKTLVSSGHKTLVFEKKNEGTWNYLVKKEHIEALKNANGGSDVTLSIEDGTTTNLDGLQPESLKKLFEVLEQNKTLFSNSNSTGTSKTIIFKTVNSNWKHIKVVLEEKLKEKFGDKASLNLKDGNDTKDTSKISDEDLKKLLSHLTTNENELLKFKKDDQTSLTFKKESETFKLVQTQQTIEAWVKTTAGDNTTLETWNNGEKKTLSTLQETELESLFTAISSADNKDLFNKGETAVVKVFEKDGTEWKHIKKAIESLITNKWDKSKIKIKKDKDSEATNFNDVTDDNLLTGLFKHIKENKDSTYSSLTTTSDITFVKDGNDWKKDGQ